MIGGSINCLRQLALQRRPRMRRKRRMVRRKRRTILPLFIFLFCIQLDASIFFFNWSMLVGFKLALTTSHLSTSTELLSTHASTHLPMLLSRCHRNIFPGTGRAPTKLIQVVIMNRSRPQVDHFWILVPPAMCPNIRSIVVYKLLTRVYIFQLVLATFCEF